MHKVPKSVLRTLLGRMQLTLHATRRTPLHGAPRLVQGMSARLVKTGRAPPGRSRDARVYDHTTTAMHKLSTPPPRHASCSALAPTLTLSLTHPRQFYPYVIIGYGVAGQSALRALLAHKPAAKVLVVDAQTDPPESRPNSPPSECSPEGKPQWGGNGFAGVGRGWGLNTGGGVKFAMGSRVTALDADRGTVTVWTHRALGNDGRAEVRGGAGRKEGWRRRGEGEEEGGGGGKEGGKAVLQEVEFGKCLLALGSRPRPPPPGFVDPAVWGSVSLLGSRGGGGLDREELSREVAGGRSVTIVGSSWQALELACSVQEGRIASSPEKVE